MTHITDEHRRAFEALTSGTHDNFALFSCFVGGSPAAAIVAVNRCPPAEQGPYLAWLSLTFLERLPGRFLRPVPVALGRFRYRSGFVARRSAEDLPPLRRFEAIVRETALGHPG